MTHMESKNNEGDLEKIELGQEKEISTSEQLLAEIDESRNELNAAETESNETFSNLVASVEKAAQEMDGDPDDIFSIKNEVADLEQQKKSIVDISRAEIEALAEEGGNENKPDARFSDLIEHNSFVKGVEKEQLAAESFIQLLNEKPPEKRFLRKQQFDQYGETKIYEIDGKEFDEYSTEVRELDAKEFDWRISTDTTMRRMNRFQWNEVTHMLHQDREQAKKFFDSINKALSERMRNEEKIEILRNIPGAIAGDIDNIDFRNFTEVLPLLAKNTVGSFEETKKEMALSSGDTLQDDWNKSRALGRFVEDLALFDKLNTPPGAEVKEGYIFSAAAKEQGVDHMDMEASEQLPTGGEELQHMRGFAREQILKITSEHPEYLTKVLDLEFVSLDTNSRGNENDTYTNGKNKAAAHLATIIDSGILSRGEVKTMLHAMVETIKNDPDKITDKDTVIGSITALVGTGSLTTEEVQEILGA